MKVINDWQPSASKWSLKVEFHTIVIIDKWWCSTIIGQQPMVEVLVVSNNKWHWTTKDKVMVNGVRGNMSIVVFYHFPPLPSNPFNFGWINFDGKERPTDSFLVPFIHQLIWWWERWNEIINSERSFRWNGSFIPIIFDEKNEG